MSNIKPNAQSGKKEYVKSVFVGAAKTIILREGAENVTVRKIADITGYSYAAVYHYYTDLDELLLDTKLSMIRDMVMSGSEKTEQETEPLQRVKDQTRFPVDFFLDNPNIFRFFYAYKLDERNITAMQSLELEKAYWDDYMPFVEKGMIRRSDIPAIARTILYAVYGMITLYLSNNGLTREDIYRDMDNMIDLLLNAEGGNRETE